MDNIGNLLAPDCNLDRLALIDLSLSDPRSFSFRDIDQMSNAAARGLADKKIKIGDKVALLANNCVELISILFGAMRYGAIPVLINNKLQRSQIADILIESESKILFTDQHCDFDLENINLHNGFTQFLNFGKFTCEKQIPNTAAILYTSGSTGKAKGVPLSHAGHLWSLERNLKHDTRSADRISLISAPLFHANGFSTFTGSFLGQSTIVLMPKFDSAACLAAIEHYKINTMYCVPSMLAMMLLEKDIEATNLDSLKLIRSASSHISSQLIKSAAKYFKNARFVNSYGITEIGPALFGPHPNGIDRPIDSVGYPADGIQYRIVNDILQIQVPFMLSQYTNQNLSLTPDGFFITNDLFRVDDYGFYYFLGRADDMFKCGGNSVYCGQIEEILMSHPAVMSAVVIGIKDDIKGHVPHAVVILARNQLTTEHELKQYVISKTAAYQHPRRIWFVDHFPVLANNKIDRNSLHIYINNNK